MNIYRRGVADTLTDHQYFSNAIRDYLHQEQELLLRLVRPYTHVVEAGCTTGRYAGIMTGMQKLYTGIDIARHHIIAAEQLHINNALASFACDDVYNLQQIIVAAPRTLIIFPFNCFGNLEDPERMLQILKNMCIDFVIATYGTDDNATLIRKQYFTACGFEDICTEKTETGVRMEHCAGISSIAHSREWMTARFAALRLECSIKPFGNIGYAYCNFM